MTLEAELKKVGTDIMRPRRRMDRKGIAETYHVTCDEQHELDLSLDELSDLIDTPNCPFELDDKNTCDASIDSVEPDEILLECKFCGDVQALSWAEMDRTCYQCPGGEPSDNALQVCGATSTRHDVVTDFYELELDAGWEIERPDYWEIVTHFTTPERFVKILRDTKITAHPTGYFRLPAVCLTEVPHLWVERLTKRFGNFGFAFFKADLLALGGAPAINLPQVLIAELPPIPDRMKPFVNKADPTSNFYFLHEREWRLPHDLDFKTQGPHLVLPNDPLKHLSHLLEPEELGAACNTYGVLGHHAR